MDKLGKQKNYLGTKIEITITEISGLVEKTKQRLHPLWLSDIKEVFSATSPTILDTKREETCQIFFFLWFDVGRRECQWAFSTAGINKLQYNQKGQQRKKTSTEKNLWADVVNHAAVLRYSKTPSAQEWGYKFQYWPQQCSLQHQSWFGWTSPAGNKQTDGEEVQLRIKSITRVNRSDTTLGLPDNVM